MSVPCVVLRPVDMPAERQGAGDPLQPRARAFRQRAGAGQRQHAGAARQYRHASLQLWRRDGAARLSDHLAPICASFGERSDGGNPYPGRDKCNVHFIRGMILGIYTLTLNIWDMKCCVDYLQTRPEVDPQRIGMMGLSQGGTMTTFTTAGGAAHQGRRHHRLCQFLEGLWHPPRQLLRLAGRARRLSSTWTRTISPG